MTQDYATKHADTIKGQFLMGSVLLRDTHEFNEDGSSHFNYNVPTLTVGGTKDGLLRVTRLTEAYYQQVENIESAQAGMFPVFAVEGTTHMSYMTGEPPKHVKDKDLKPDVDGDTAKQIFAAEFVKFIDNVLTQNWSNYDEQSTADVLDGLLQGFKMESSYQMKPPCYGHETINPVDDPTCGHGNEWTVEVTQKVMGGYLNNDNITVVNDDNFHRVQSIAPVHLPYISDSCSQDTTAPCTLNTVTISENYYEKVDALDTGSYPTSAYEIKTKISSRQAVEVAAGIADADFHTTDEEGNRCADINQHAIDWALTKASPAALDNYNTYGIKMVVGDDKGPYNEGPLWIWTYMSYNVDDAKTTMTVQSPMMRTPLDYPISSAAGFHYCKVLSPFRVLEHMYIDSLYERDGLASDNATSRLFLQ